MPLLRSVRCQDYANRLFATMSKKRVFVAFPAKVFPASSLKLLHERVDVKQWEKAVPPTDVEVRTLIEGCQGLLCDPFVTINRELVECDSAAGLKVVSTISVGLDHVDLESCSKRGIKIGNTPDAVTAPTAELAVSLTLATMRCLIPGVDLAKGRIKNDLGPWGYIDPRMLGDGLQGKTVGIFGMGRIGRATAERLIPFRPARMLYHNRTRKLDAEKALSLPPQYVSFDELLSRSDVLIVTCALTPQTRGVFSAAAFAQMKPSAYFVNVSRGDVVDQNALCDALSNGKLKAAGLDVTSPEPLPLDHALLSLRNAVILPHLGTSTTDTLAEMIDVSVRNVVTGVYDEQMPFEVTL